MTSLQVFLRLILLPFFAVSGFSDRTIVPHGIYDVGTNTGYLTLGTSHDTAEFVCDNFVQVWREHLQWRYPNADTICILCDDGGSNACSHHVVKQALMKLSSTIGVNIIMLHYPPYCSKYERTYETKRPIEESYESEKSRRIVFDEELPKWNCLIKCS